MIILDEPYASVPLLDWMEASAHPVLANGFTEKLVAGGRTLNLVDADECARRLEAGERIYTNSENALAWILDHVDNPTITDAIRLFKDKAAMREKLEPLSPGLFHETVDRAGLEAVNVADLPLPVVLKPSVGFCSMGVYVIEEPEDWAAAVADIARREDGWHERYPESVVGSSEYLIEGYLAGTEYALDAYFDEDGAPHILNILRHDFAGPEDTSDRMYLTDGTIVDAWNDRFTAWLAAVNGTDVAFYGVGLRTYEAFLEDTPVDLAALYAAHPGKVYSMSLLNPAPEADLARPFDGAALCERFSHVLAYHVFDPVTVGFYGFLFLETDAEGTGADERDWLLRSDLMEFVGGAL